MTQSARNIMGLVGGFVLGLLITAPITAYAQTQDGSQANPFLVTQTGGWNHTVQCDVSNLGLTYSIDGAAAVPAAGLTWSGTAAPFTATMPLSQMPAAARTVGPHSIAVIVPPTTITLADGSPYTYPSATLTSYFKVLPDTPTSTPPRNPKWIKIVGTIFAIGLGVWALLGLAH